MSSFLSAAENVAQPRQNLRRDLKKTWRKNAERLSLRRRVIFCLYLVWLYRKNVSFTVRQFVYIFGTIVTLLTLHGIVSWSLMMRKGLCHQPHVSKQTVGIPVLCVLIFFLKRNVLGGNTVRFKYKNIWKIQKFDSLYLFSLDFTCVKKFLPIRATDIL